MNQNSEFSDFLRALKERCDIVEVIGSYIKLERRGSNYWACCPFHHEKTPSFSINAPDKYYHCFGCGASGDVIGFVKEYENLEFMQAVQLLAGRAGLEVPAYDDRAAEEASAMKKKRDRLSSLMRDAARFYLNNLYSGRAQIHVDYLAKRGLQPSTVKRFGLGASLDYAGLPAHLLAQGYTPEECIESGACVRTDEGRIIDAEGERLIIPIINHMDEVVAFGGRILRSSDRAKYKNTRETMLFNKSKNLFNINLVKREKRAAAIPYLIMVEGYMDAISLYQAGFRNVVASMGTSLTKEQARLARRYTEQVLISYDGDFAGQKANLRGLGILKEEGLKVRVVPMPEGLDPDDVIKTQGRECYQSCLDAAMPLIDFRILAVQRKYDLTKTDEKRDFIREVLPILNDAESAAEREELLGRISASTGISKAALQSDLDRLGPQEAPRPPSVPAERGKEADGEKKAARFVLAACLLSKPYATECDLSAYDFSDEEHRTVAGYIAEGRRTGNLRPSGLFDLMRADGELSEILNLDYGDNLDGAQAEKYFYDCLASLERRSLTARIALERERYALTESAEEKREILLKIQEYTKKLNEAKKAGGRA